MMKTDYLRRIQDFRDARDLRFKTNPQSWLALIGLFRLKDGENTFGAGDSNKIKLVEFGLEKCGSFHLQDGKITLIPSLSAGMTVNNLPPTPRMLNTDREEEPDIIRVGTLAMKIIMRGQDFYLRVWDRESPAIKNFTSLRYFPIKPEYQIQTKFVIYKPPKEIRIQDVIGNEYGGHLIGEARFSLNGVDCSLVAEEDEDGLLFSFTDKTRDDLTYPGGRQLTTPKPEGDQLTIDFNLAVNWPCAYTEFATCPLPPAENHLPIRIEAGEMRYMTH